MSHTPIVIFHVSVKPNAQAIPSINIYVTPIEATNTIKIINATIKKVDE